jgi:hypothetical protein
MTHDTNDVVRVYTGPLVLVEVYQTALTDAGIASRVVGTDLAGSFGSALPESIELWVRKTDLPRAKEVIEREEQPKSKEGHDRPRQRFPHPTNDPKPGPAPYRKEPYVNPDPGS